MSKYVYNKASDIVCNRQKIMTSSDVVTAIKQANSALKALNEYTKNIDINIFDALGMRNLSGLIGEFFAKCVVKVSNGNLKSNLHQDGYPDLLLTNTKEKLEYYKTLYIVRNGEKYPKDKVLFSPYKYGGIEVKACCGSTPPAKNIPKPLIGEQRISIVKSFDWKAHHRDTNNLLAVLWDFIDSYPVIVAAFYQNKLSQDDWGKIVVPKDDGGRTTSVSIMKTSGVKKMCKNWIAVIDDDLYREKLAKAKWIGYDVKDSAMAAII